MPALQRKKLTIIKGRLAVLALITTFLLTACGGGGGGGSDNSATQGSGSGGNTTNTPLQATAPTIASQPQNQTAIDGGLAVFSISVNGTSPFTFQWKKNGTDVPGATSAIYQISAAAFSDDGAAYTAVISNAAGSVTSAPATLTVHAVSPTIVASPQAQSILAGTTTTFNVIVTGTPPLSFQWRKNGAPISGATSATYTTPVTTPLYNNTSYDVAVTNNQGTVFSQSALLQVTPVPNAVTIVTQPVTMSVSEGSVATFTVAASGTGPFTYQWFKNGVPVAGGYESTLTIAPATALDNGGQLSVDVSNALGTATSNSASLAVNTGAISLLLGSAGGWGNIDGPAALARFASLCGITADSAGNYFVSDTINNTIRKISSVQTVSTLAGLSQYQGSSDGSGSNARFSAPGAITRDSLNDLYVVDTANQTIRKITAAGVVTTLAGSAGNSGAINGTGTGARFNFEVNPISCSIFGQSGVAADTSGNIYVADSNNHAIRKVTQGGVVTTFAGALGQMGFVDGPASTARFNHPTGIAFDSAQNLYVIDRSAKLRKISSLGEVTSLPGIIPVSDGAIMFANNGDIIVSGYGSIYKYDPTGSPSFIADSPFGLSNQASALALSPNGDTFVADSYGVRRINLYNQVSSYAGNLGPIGGFSDGAASSAKFNQISGIASDNSGGVYFTDISNNTVRKLSASGTVSTIAGVHQQPGSADGSSTTALFNNPDHVARDASGNLYVSDSASHTIRKIATDGTVTTIAGAAGISGFTDGAAGVSRLHNPGGLVVDTNANIYFIDKDNFAIRRISNTGIVSTIAGTGVSGSADGTGILAGFSNLRDIAIDTSGNLYVTDHYSIRKITSAGIVTTFAGSLIMFGTNDGTGSSARFSFPTGIAIDAGNNLYVTDSNGGGVIRKITPAAVVTTVAGNAGVWGTGLGSLPGSFDYLTTIAIAPSVSGTSLYVSNGNSLLLVSLP